MTKKKTPPVYAESGGPMMVACQLNMSSPTGPAEQFPGGSMPKSCNSLCIRFNAIPTASAKMGCRTEVQRACPLEPKRLEPKRLE
eukprot:CAMPEP_0204585808 /NCGR_PEP_ID=MMETSP0661-20131031/47132_1 /ASSEMBLY_ACC=CAM_ASM_000606 /TAXON_ID=109239 /ORGANISM="Alexandrium margalefi, Strain AMGDE01CS-322" /LENGTH=84 /DNA_ID=CAMNT_0051595395 /DNA_START=346 /DNA_END=597 /DNA_ORIENTATION=-